MEREGSSIRIWKKDTADNEIAQKKNKKSLNVSKISDDEENWKEFGVSQVELNFIFLRDVAI